MQCEKVVESLFKSKTTKKKFGGNLRGFLVGWAVDNSKDLRLMFLGKKTVVWISRKMAFSFGNGAVLMPATPFVIVHTQRYMDTHKHTHHTDIDAAEWPKGNLR